MMTFSIFNAIVPLLSSALRSEAVQAIFARAPTRASSGVVGRIVAQGEARRSDMPGSIRPEGRRQPARIG